MLVRRRGHLLAISSLASYRGLPGLAGYCATKAAVNTLMEGLRPELKAWGIGTTIVCPGWLRTPMTESLIFRMPYLMEPDEAARLIIAALRRGRDRKSVV